MALGLSFASLMRICAKRFVCMCFEPYCRVFLNYLVFVFYSGLPNNSEHPYVMTDVPKRSKSVKWMEASTWLLNMCECCVCECVGDECIV